MVQNTESAEKIAKKQSDGAAAIRGYFVPTAPATEAAYTQSDSALRIFLTMCVSIASCERSFSKLKLIKTYLRSTMSEARLTNLAMLSTERHTAKIINFDDVIRDFAAVKARKIRL